MENSGGICETTCRAGRNYGIEAQKNKKIWYPDPFETNKLQWEIDRRRNKERGERLKNIKYLPCSRLATSILALLHMSEM